MTESESSADPCCLDSQGGVWSDWFTTAVRTGGAGGAGISVLMIPRTKGVKTRHIEVSAGVMGGTAYVTFDDVEVPVENLLGKINEGFKTLMTNLWVWAALRRVLWKRS